MSPPTIADRALHTPRSGSSGAGRDPAPGPPESLYLHVPFCVSVCPYCDFVVVAGAAARGPRNRMGSFLAALRREIELRADALDSRWGPPGTPVRPALRSVYVGGGTPSLLPAGEVAAILDLIGRRFGLQAGAEVTIEANPGPDERGRARELRAAGVTRISYGAQALDDGLLVRIGRRHRVADVQAALAEARAAAIPSVSLDLLYDLPGQALDDWEATLEQAIMLGPDHLSLYALALDDPDAEGLTGPFGDHLPATRGARRWRAVARTAQDEDRAATMYSRAIDRLSAAGYESYEISNWARPGHESRHNMGYWERRPGEAVGPGAHAFDGAVRRWNAARLDGWVAALVPERGVPARLPPGGEEALDASTAALEQVILGLRTSRGVPLSTGGEPPLAAHLEWALAGGLAHVTPDERIILTTRGRLLSNELFSRLV